MEECHKNNVPDPAPAPDPSINKQKNEEKPLFLFFVTSENVKIKNAAKSLYSVDSL
jgi:hypothetical protein